MKVIIQADPIAKLKFATDTTLYVAQELQKRGAELFFFQPKDMSYQDGKVVYNNGYKVILDYSSKKYSAKPTPHFDAAKADLIFIRQNPPFDDFYYYTCKLLATIEQQTSIINRPSGIANLPEKITPMLFPQYAPKTILSFAVSDYQKFFKMHKKVIIKPLNEFGGSNIMLLKSPLDFTKYFPQYLKQHKYVIMQEYLTGVAKHGDKRVILLDGKILTQYTKLPEKGSIVTNLVAGGTAIPCTLTKREKEVSTAVGKLMRENGIFLAGLDIADEKLLEVNITSPTGLVTASKLYNKDYAKIVVDAIEKHVLNQVFIIDI